MSIDKSAGVFGPSSAETEAALQKFYGDRLLNSVGAGAGAGLGVTALYHLLRGAKPMGKKEKKYPGYGSGTPMVAKQAFDINSVKEMLGRALPTTMLPFSAPALGNGAAPAADPHAWRKSWSTAANIGGAGLGALAGHHVVNSLVKAKKKRDQAAALDAARQEYYGALLGKNANLLPTAISPGVLGGAAIGAFGGGATGAALGAYNAPKGQKWQAAQRGALIGGGLGAGASGLLHGIVKVVPRAPKPPLKIAAVQTAQADYYAALAGDQTALDTAFEAVKSANLLTDAVSGAYNTPQTLRTAYLLSLLGAGGFGAKYMYDKTKATTAGENLAKAQASRARMRGLPPIYVDPDGLAQVKADAKNNG